MIKFDKTKRIVPKSGKPTCVMYLLSPFQDMKVILLSCSWNKFNTCVRCIFIESRRYHTSLVRIWNNIELDENTFALFKVITFLAKNVRYTTGIPLVYYQNSSWKKIRTSPRVFPKDGRIWDGWVRGRGQKNYLTHMKKISSPSEKRWGSGGSDPMKICWYP